MCICMYMIYGERYKVQGHALAVLSLSFVGARACSSRQFAGLSRFCVRSPTPALLLAHGSLASRTRADRDTAVMRDRAPYPGPEGPRVRERKSEPARGETQQARDSKSRKVESQKQSWKTEGRRNPPCHRFPR